MTCEHDACAAREKHRVFTGTFDTEIEPTRQCAGGYGSVAGRVSAFT